MAINNTIAARITLDPMQAAINRYTRHKTVSYQISFGYYFNNKEQGEGYEPLEIVSDHDLPILIKIAELAQAEVKKLRAADDASSHPADDAK